MNGTLILSDWGKIVLMRTVGRVNQGFAVKIDGFAGLDKSARNRRPEPINDVPPQSVAF
jgi:hypothetical protein